MGVISATETAASLAASDRQIGHDPGTSALSSAPATAATCCRATAGLRLVYGAST